jgi:hypothetical protein
VKGGIVGVSVAAGIPNARAGFSSMPFAEVLIQASGSTAYTLLCPIFLEGLCLHLHPLSHTREKTNPVF